jgi:hypothetical protein
MTHIPSQDDSEEVQQARMRHMAEKHSLAYVKCPACKGAQMACETCKDDRVVLTFNRNDRSCGSDCPLELFKGN